MEYIEVTGKSVEEAITNACTKLGIPSDKLDYEVIDKGNSGFLGIFNSKPAKIKAREKQEEPEVKSVETPKKSEEPVHVEKKFEKKTDDLKKAEPKKEFKSEPKKEFKKEHKPADNHKNAEVKEAPKAEAQPKEEPFTEEQKEVIRKDIKAFLDSSSRMDENINLPQYIADSKVHYEESEKPVSPLLFVLLGGAAILVVIIADKKKVKDNAIKRKKELLYDYSEVVSKLTLLLGAGMTTRMAWHKIAADYKDNIEHGKAVRRPVYDEICKTDYNIQAGISELKAYEQFGKRCDTREYMKLAALLQTNIRKGTKELRRLLEEETADAFEKRKNMAKIKGEEATTKLLMPMMMMLMIVMAIIMIPAVWSFQI